MDFNNNYGKDIQDIQYVLRWEGESSKKAEKANNFAFEEKFVITNDYLVVKDMELIYYWKL